MLCHGEYCRLIVKASWQTLLLIYIRKLVVHLAAPGSKIHLRGKIFGPGVIFETGGLKKSGPGTNSDKKSLKIAFWGVLFQKIPIKSYFGIYFDIKYL